LTRSCHNRNDPYKSESGADPALIEKMWSDPRLHGNKKKMGTDERGRPVFSTMDGAAKRDKQKGEALSMREREFDLMQEKKRRMEELMAAEAELVEANRPAKKVGSVGHRRGARDACCCGHLTPGVHN